MVSISSYMTDVWAICMYAHLLIFLYIYVLAVKLCFGQRVEAGECNGRTARESFAPEKKCLFSHRGLDGRTKFLTVEKTNHSEFDLYILSGYANMPIRPSNALKANR